MIEDRDTGANGDSADDRAVDFSPLDPLRDETRFAAIVGRIAREADAVRRRGAGSAPAYGAIAYVSRWSAPILAAAALVIAVAAPLLLWSGGAQAPVPPAASSPSGANTAAPDRWGIPGAIAALAQSRSDPTPAQVIAAFGTKPNGAGQ